MMKKFIPKTPTFLVWVLIALAVIVFIRRPEIFTTSQSQDAPYTEESTSSDATDETKGVDGAEVITVDYVVDGDTLVLSTGEKVRLLGIDTPERGEPFSNVARVRLAALVEGKPVRLERDVSTTDRYGRLLRHVYVDTVWINKLMIDEGLARMVTFPPDTMHVQTFRAAQDAARSTGKGLWGF